MKRALWIFLMAVAVMGIGCDAVSNKVTRENITGATLNFTPDVAVANVDTWWYQFDTAGTNVVGCNSNNHVYQATGWDFDEEAQNVTVYFGGGYESYTLEADSDSLESGRFTYTNSNGDQMEGNWERVSSRPCDNM